MKKYSIIILAAGSSSRLGTPKQLLPFDNATLIQHSINIAKQTDASSIIAVLGSNAEKIREAIVGERITITVNNDWEEGIASSIRTGIELIKNQQEAVEAVILMVCDQPYTTSGVLLELVQKFEESTKPIIASEYAGTLGTPVLFDKSFFNELQKLSGDSGTKKLLQHHNEQVAAIPFAAGEIDIDNKEDLKHLKS